MLVFCESFSPGIGRIDLKSAIHTANQAAELRLDKLVQPLPYGKLQMTIDATPILAYRASRFLLHYETRTKTS